MTFKELQNGDFFKRKYSTDTVFSNTIWVKVDDYRNHFNSMVIKGVYFDADSEFYGLDDDVGDTNTFANYAQVIKLNAVFEELTNDI